MLIDEYYKRDEIEQPPAKKILFGILKELIDCRGLRHEWCHVDRWGHIDGDIREEVLQGWLGIIESNLIDERKEEATKPQPKCEVAIDLVLPTAGMIYFYASPDAIGDFEEFGFVRSVGKWGHLLCVDGRYDFAEVVEYIKNYG